MAEFTVHGITFIRSGECSQCGACGCDRDGCPHFMIKQGTPTCKIYSKRDQYCNVCGMTHQGCIDFPDNPWIYVVRDGICAYTFERKDGGSMDDLPFLNGQPWSRAGGG